MKVRGNLKEKLILWLCVGRCGLHGNQSGGTLFHICPGLNTNEIQIQIQASQSVLTGKKSPKHKQFCQI